jgi:hypothetical protein
MVPALAAWIMVRTNAGAVPLTFEGVTSGDSDYISVNVPAHAGSAAYNINNLDVYVGFSTYSIGSGPVVDSFCMDFYNDSNPSQLAYTPISLASGPVASAYGNVGMGASAALTIEKLWALNYATAQGNATTAAVLQEAVWLTEALAAGGTFTGATYGAQAQTMYNDALAYSGNLNLPPLFDYSNPSYQDYIGVPDGGATAALLGLSFAGLAMIRRKYLSL